MPNPFEAIDRGKAAVRTALLSALGFSLEIQDFFWGGGSQLSEGLPPDEYYTLPLPIPPQSKPEIPTPIDNPINIVKPPPRKIYRDPFAPFIPDGFDIIYPDLPDPQLPKPPLSPETTVDSTFVVTQAQGLKDRKFGCLLHKPYYRRDIEWCYYDERTPDEFWDEIFTGMEQFIQNLIDTAIDNVTDIACKSAIALLPLPFLQKAILMVGCRYMNDVAVWYFRRNKEIDNYPSTGLLSVGNINRIYCGVKEEVLPDDDYSLDGSQDNCCPCLEYEFDNIGLKHPVLQIMWRSVSNQTPWTRKLTEFPCPIHVDLITKNLLKTTLPKRLDMGIQLFEISFKCPEIEGFEQKTKAHIASQLIEPVAQTNFIQDTYKRWLDNLCDEGLILHSWKVINYDNESQRAKAQGEYFPYKYKYFRWSIKDDKPSKWECINTGFIYTKPPEID